MVAAVKANPFYQWLWQKFKDFCVDTCEKLQWVKKTGKMEVTVRRRNPQNLVHFHLGVSDMGRKHRLRDAQEWAFLGARPHIQPTGIARCARVRCGVRSTLTNTSNTLTNTERSHFGPVYRNPPYHHHRIPRPTQCRESSTCRKHWTPSS